MIKDNLVDVELVSSASLSHLSHRSLPHSPIPNPAPFFLPPRVENAHNAREQQSAKDDANDRMLPREVLLIARSMVPVVRKSASPQAWVNMAMRVDLYKCDFLWYQVLIKRVFHLS